MAIQKIGVIGVGGVGGYFGGKLCRLLREKSGYDVAFIARGEHLRVIQESGLLLDSEEDGEILCRPSLATDDFSRLPELDLCLVCVKEFDLPDVLTRLAPHVGQDTIVLPLLNGVDVYSRVRSVISPGIVLSACVYVGTHIERPGKVLQRGGACKIFFGPDSRRPDFDARPISRLFQQAGIHFEWAPDVQSEIWKKFIFVGPFGLVGAAYGKTLGNILDDPVLSHALRGIMTEARSLALASGVSLPEDVVERSLAKARDFPYETKTSFHRDFERLDKKDERDLFAGTMIRLGRELGIELPETNAVSALLGKRKPGSKPRPKS